MPKTETIDVKHELTSEEINELAKNLAEQLRRFGTVSEEKKTVMSSYKADLDSINKDIQEMASKIALGYFFEPQECYVEIDEVLNKKIYRDAAKLTVLKEEDIISDQPGIFSQTKIGEDGALQILVTHDPESDKIGRAHV